MKLVACLVTLVVASALLWSPVASQGATWNSSSSTLVFSTSMLMGVPCTASFQSECYFTTITPVVGNIAVIPQEYSALGVNLLTGAVEWFVNTSMAVSPITVATSDDTGFYFVDGYQVLKVHVNGTYAWNSSAMLTNSILPLVAGRGLVFYWSSSCTLHALNATTGDVQWSTNLDAQFCGLGEGREFLTIGSRVVLAGYNNRFSDTTTMKAVSLKDGLVLWSSGVTVNQLPVFVPNPMSTTKEDLDVFVACTFDGNDASSIVGLRQSSLSVAWNVSTGDPSFGSLARCASRPVLLGTDVFAVNSEGDIARLNGITGGNYVVNSPPLFEPTVNVPNVQVGPGASTLYGSFTSIVTVSSPLESDWSGVTFLGNASGGASIDASAVSTIEYFDEVSGVAIFTCNAASVVLIVKMTV